MTYKEVKELVKRLDAELRADDPRLRHHVVVIHEEGTFYHFRWSFALDYGEYLMVFSEHHSAQVFSKDELHSWWQYKQTKIKKYKENENENDHQ